MTWQVGRQKGAHVINTREAVQYRFLMLAQGGSTDTINEIDGSGERYSYAHQVRF